MNSASGVFKGHENWSAKDKLELGVRQLVRAFKLYQDKALRHWYLVDTPAATNKVQLCGTIYFRKVSSCLGGTPYA